MKQFTLKKEHKLTAMKAIERLFNGKDVELRQALSYPIRAVWLPSFGRPAGMDTHKFLISVPKKRLRHAVDRVAMRRRIREAYRLNHKSAESAVTENEPSLPFDIAFIYVANRLLPYDDVERAMRRLLSTIHSPRQ